MEWKSGCIVHITACEPEGGDGDPCSEAIVAVANQLGTKTGLFA